MRKLVSAFLFSMLLASPLCANDDSIFTPPVTENPPGIPEGGIAGPIHVLGYKKVPPGEALNQVSINAEVAGLESRASVNGKSELKNVYLAFAIDVRYARDCSASKSSALCTFYHSGARLGANVGWSDMQSSDRYEIVLVPIEYVTGYFGKEGPDLKTTSGALFATAGARIEYLRDLGLGVEQRVLTSLGVSLNYASQTNPLGEKAGFRWIGSVRLFGGCSNVDGELAHVCNGLAGGLETQIGLVFDLEKGDVAFTNLSRLEGDVGLGGNDHLLGMSTNKVEVKYMRPVCRDESNGACRGPNKFSYGGGVRYEYSTASYEHEGLPDGTASQDRAVHRLMMFVELARF